MDSLYQLLVFLFIVFLQMLPVLAEVLFLSVTLHTMTEFSGYVDKIYANILINLGIVTIGCHFIFGELLGNPELYYIIGPFLIYLAIRLIGRISKVTILLIPIIMLLMLLISIVCVFIDILVFPGLGYILYITILFALTFTGIASDISETVWLFLIKRWNNSLNIRGILISGSIVSYIAMILVFTRFIN